ncbi:MAG: hypothetical protein KUG72_13280 [Pseudomonadales bacterium]|nr:hypothetical protein [Pseudomonadales bacterium]
MKKVICTLVLMSIASPVAFAADVDALIKSKLSEIKETTDSMVSYVEDGNPRAALKELEWLRSLIAPIEIEIIKETLFLDKVGEFSATGPATYQSAMSVTTIKREYRNGDTVMKMQLISMGSPGAANPMANFAALAQQYGQQQNQVRLGRRIMANVMPQGSSTKLMAAIGGYNFEVKGENEDQVIAFAKALPMKKFETYVGKD